PTSSQGARPADSTMPAPNAQPVPSDGAAPPTTTGATNAAGPFSPTSFDDWNGFGSHGRGARLPLVGDAELISQPIVAPAYQLPLIEQSGGARGYQPFDPYEVGKDFPILEERIHGGKRG